MKWIYQIGIGLLLALNMSLLWKYKEQKKRLTTNKQTIISQHQNLESLRETTQWLQSSRIIANELVEKKIPEFQIHDNNGQPYELLELFGKKPKLCYYFSELHCDLCIRQELKLINKHVDQFGEENILLFASFQNPNDVLLNSIISPYSFQYFLIKGFHDAMKFQGNDAPFVWVMDHSLQMNQLFIPSKSLPDYSRSFYKMLLRRYDFQ